MNPSSVSSTIGPSQAANPNSLGSETRRKTILNQEDFLNLFFTQMKYQNPLQPMDNYQMANQMAQMNTVEALKSMNQTLNNIGTSQTSLNQLLAPGLIGRAVEAKGNRISIIQGKVLDGTYQLSQPGKVLIQIFDTNGNLVREIPVGMKDASKQKVNWDGKDQKGATLPDGTYSFQVTAVDAKGQSVPVTTLRAGIISGVTLEGGKVYFDMGGEKISLNEVMAFSG